MICRDRRARSLTSSACDRSVNICGSTRYATKLGPRFFLPSILNSRAKFFYRVIWHPDCSLLASHDHTYNITHAGLSLLGGSVDVFHLPSVAVGSSECNDESRIGQTGRAKAGDRCCRQLSYGVEQKRYYRQPFSFRCSIGPADRLRDTVAVGNQEANHG